MAGVCEQKKQHQRRLTCIAVRMEECSLDRTYAVLGVALQRYVLSSTHVWFRVHELTRIECPDITDLPCRFRM